MSTRESKKAIESTSFVRQNGFGIGLSVTFAQSGTCLVLTMTGTGANTDANMAITTARPKQSDAPLIVRYFHLSERLCLDLETKNSTNELRRSLRHKYW